MSANTDRIHTQISGQVRPAQAWAHIPSITERADVDGRYGCGEAGLTCRVTCLSLSEGRLLEFLLLGAC